MNVNEELKVFVKMQKKKKWGGGGLWSGCRELGWM